MRPKMIKTGDQVRVRRVGTEVWVLATVDLASANQKSLAVSAEEGLGTPQGVLFNRKTARMALLLLKDSEDPGYYSEIHTLSQWEVEDLELIHPGGNGHAG